MKIRIYTDGACSGNQNNENFGGYGAILEYGDYQKEIYGGQPNTTNNRMELTAIIEALSLLKKRMLDVEVFTDSAYIASCFREGWYIKWQSNGWINSAKKPVENIDLWKKIISLSECHKVRFYKVKSHVSPNSTDATWNKLLTKFKSTNLAPSENCLWTIEDLKKITDMNIRADNLATKGADEAKIKNKGD